MSERMTKERLANIRGILERGLNIVASELLTELDAVMRERDALAADMMRFTGAPTLDEAIAVLTDPVEWDAIASYHGVTISEGRKRGRRAASEESRSPGLDWVSENGGT